MNLVNIGKHLGICRSIEFGYTEKDGEQAGIAFEIVGPENNPDIGRYLAYFGGFAEGKDGNQGPIDFTMGAFRAIGWTGTDLSELPALAAANDAVAREVELVVAHEEYKGKVNAKIKFVNVPGGGVKMKKAMEPAQLKTFAATMKERLRSYSAPAAKSATASTTGGRPPGQRSTAPGGDDRDFVPPADPWQ